MCDGLGCQVWDFNGGFAMLRVPVHKIEPGMILARPIPLPHDPRRFLLQRDREIPLDIVPRLQKLGIVEVWVRHPNLEFLEDIFDEGLGDWQREVYHSVRLRFEQVMHGAAQSLDVSNFRGSISGLFSFLKASSHGSILLHKLEVFDNYLLSHSANVCYLALLLGLKLEEHLIHERSVIPARQAKDVQLLGLGCLLHDVGKMKIPPQILHKPGRLTDDEMEEMKLHTVYGYEMVSGRVSTAAAQIVRNHHQRYNGEGYPARRDGSTGKPLPSLAGRQIPIFCRIATIVDIYDAATTDRCYSGAKHPVQVLHEMRTWCAGFFDPVVEKAFYEIIPPFPIGQVVTLSDGTEAVVVDFNPRQPVRPKVQCIKTPDGEQFADPALEEIDLSLYPELEIAFVDTKDVRPFQASQQGEALSACGLPY